MTSATETGTDRITKRVHLKAPRSRVWRALSSTKEFNAWLGVELEGVFTPGARLSGRITHKGYEHLTMEIVVDRVEPETLFSYRWHPHAVDPAVDYWTEPMTLVVFTLEDEGGGTLLTVEESGFDALPAARRSLAFPMNSEGWAMQMQSIGRHVEAAE